MRDRPLGIDAVAIKAATELIEQATLGHARERQARHVQGLQVWYRSCGAGVPVPQQALNQWCVRKFRRAAKSTPVAIKAAFQLGAALAQWLGIERLIPGRWRRVHVCERAHHRSGASAQLGLVIAVVVGDMSEQIAKRGHAMAGLGRKIGAGVERPLIVVHQKHRQRPATAATAEHLLCQLVELVDVRPLFAIDLDIDEALVHERRRGFILEGFVRHYVAPVTGGIADREQNGFVLAPRQRQRLLTPGVPVHGVASVLTQVGAGFARQTVAVGAHYIAHGVCLSH